MDILLLCVYASVCGIIIYWKIVRPWNAVRHVRFLDISVPSNFDVPHKGIPVHGHARRVGEQERDSAHYKSDDILCKRIDRDKVALVGHGSGAMFLDPEFGPGIARNARPDNTDFRTASIGHLQQRLAEIQSFCSIPRAKAEIESRFPGVEVSSLRNLGILSEAGKIGRLGEYVWSGSKPDLINQQENRSDRATRQINNPPLGGVENLARQTETPEDNLRRRGRQISHDDMDWHKRH